MSYEEFVLEQEFVEMEKVYLKLGMLFWLDIAIETYKKENMIAPKYSLVLKPDSIYKYENFRYLGGAISWHSVNVHLFVISVLKRWDQLTLGKFVF